MQLEAKLIKLLPLQTGTGKNGEWKKQDIIVETDGKFPKKVCISIWGDKINESILKEGNKLDISFDVESREYNERWYTDVKAWKVELVGNKQEEAPPESFENNTSFDEEHISEDDLPF